MIIHKCDGHRFYGGKCTSEYKSTSRDDYPDYWLTIEGIIKNGLLDAHTIELHGIVHFCSKACLEITLFKGLPIKESQQIAERRIEFRQVFGKKFGFIDNKLSEREMFIEDFFLSKLNELIK